MSKRNAIISLTAVIFLWVSAAGQDVMMKRQVPEMKSAPMMKTTPSNNQKTTAAAKKKKGRGKSVQKAKKNTRSRSGGA